MARIWRSIDGQVDKPVVPVQRCQWRASEWKWFKFRVHRPVAALHPAQVFVDLLVLSKRYPCSRKQQHCRGRWPAQWKVLINIHRQKWPPKFSVTAGVSKRSASNRSSRTHQFQQHAGNTPLQTSPVLPKQLKMNCFHNKGPSGVQQQLLSHKCFPYFQC